MTVADKSKLDNLCAMAFEKAAVEIHALWDANAIQVMILIDSLVVKTKFDFEKRYLAK